VSVLRPLPLAVLVRRVITERPNGSVFGLPLPSVHAGEPGLDLSATFHGHRVSTPLGPAAGPHTQLAPNIALSYLAGGRVLELKTVQVNDRLVLARPCIDVGTIGTNVEWSQELLVHESLREYVKARLLIAILDALGLVPAGQRDVVLDVSLGYDLEGIRSRKMRDFLSGLLDARPLLDAERDALVHELPAPLRWLAYVPCPTRLADSVTLSTFHGCPPGEIAGMARYLLAEAGVHTIVKLNPTLVGYEAAREIVNGRLGYEDVRLKPEAFARDLQLPEALDLARDLAGAAARLGLGFGLKLTNTLVVENHAGHLPGKEMYLSGEPLHVLALGLALTVREALGAAFPISFSAGIGAGNVATAVACGMVPVSSCTDLLRPGGYARLQRQAHALAEAMRAAGARTIPELIRAKAGQPGGDLAEASLEVHRRAAADALTSGRYVRERTSRPPRKVGSHLHLMDCLGCDKCVPVCPNDANFAYETPARTLAYRDLVVAGGQLVPGVERVLSTGGPKHASHQIANFADACNDCGNCDVFCPEEGGPHIEKPRLHGTLAGWLADAPKPGFHVAREDGALHARGRWGGHTVELRIDADGSARFWDGVAELLFPPDDPLAPAESRVLALPPPEGHVVPIGHYHSLRALVEGLFAPGAASWITSLDPLRGAPSPPPAPLAGSPPDSPGSHLPEQRS